MLPQKKQQEVEEQHNQLCMSKVSCPQLLDPVTNKVLLFIYEVMTKYVNQI